MNSLESFAISLLALSVTLIIFDHIHLAISGLKDHDERKAIDNLMTNLRLFVEQTGVGLITVAHLRRNNKDSFNDGGSVSLTDLRGSSALEQLADIVIASERNQQGDDSNVTQLRLLKNRPYGVVGPAGKVALLQRTRPAVALRRHLHAHRPGRRRSVLTQEEIWNLIPKRSPTR